MCEARNRAPSNHIMKRVLGIIVIFKLLHLVTADHVPSTAIGESIRYIDIYNDVPGVKTSLDIELDVNSQASPSKVIMLLNPNITVHDCSVSLDSVKAASTLALHKPITATGAEPPTQARWPLITGVSLEEDPVSTTPTDSTADAAGTRVSFTDAAADFTHGMTTVELTLASEEAATERQDPTAAAATAAATGPSSLSLRCSITTPPRRQSPSQVYVYTIGRQSSNDVADPSTDDDNAGRADSPYVYDGYILSALTFPRIVSPKHTIKPVPLPSAGTLTAHLRIHTTHRRNPRASENLGYHSRNDDNYDSAYAASDAAYAASIDAYDASTVYTDGVPTATSTFAPASTPSSSAHSMLDGTGIPPTTSTPELAAAPAAASAAAFTSDAEVASGAAGAPVSATASVSAPVLSGLSTEELLRVGALIQTQHPNRTNTGTGANASAGTDVRGNVAAPRTVSARREAIGGDRWLREDADEEDMHEERRGSGRSQDTDMEITDLTGLLSNIKPEFKKPGKKSGDKSRVRRGRGVSPRKNEENWENSEFSENMSEEKPEVSYSLVLQWNREFQDFENSGHVFSETLIPGHLLRVRIPDTSVLKSATATAKTLCSVLGTPLGSDAASLHGDKGILRPISTRTFIPRKSEVSEITITSGTSGNSESPSVKEWYIVLEEGVRGSVTVVCNDIQVNGDWHNDGQLPLHRAEIQVIAMLPGKTHGDSGMSDNISGMAAVSPGLDAGVVLASVTAQANEIVGKKVSIASIPDPEGDALASDDLDYDSSSDSEPSQYRARESVKLTLNPNSNENGNIVANELSGDRDDANAWRGSDRAGASLAHAMQMDLPRVLREVVGSNDGPDNTQNSRYSRSSGRLSRYDGKNDTFPEFLWNARISRSHSASSLSFAASAAGTVPSDDTLRSDSNAMVGSEGTLSIVIDSDTTAYIHSLISGNSYQDIFPIPNSPVSGRGKKGNGFKKNWSIRREVDLWEYLPEGWSVATSTTTASTSASGGAAADTSDSVMPVSCRVNGQSVAASVRTAGKLNRGLLLSARISDILSERVESASVRAGSSVGVSLSRGWTLECDGLRVPTTVTALEAPVPLMVSVAGVVEMVGSGVERVATNDDNSNKMGASRRWFVIPAGGYTLSQPLPTVITPTNADNSDDLVDSTEELSSGTGARVASLRYISLQTLLSNDDDDNVDNSDENADIIGNNPESSLNSRSRTTTVLNTADSSRNSLGKSQIRKMDVSSYYSGSLSSVAERLRRHVRMYEAAEAAQLADQATEAPAEAVGSSTVLPHTRSVQTQAVGARSAGSGSGSAADGAVVSPLEEVHVWQLALQPLSSLTMATDILVMTGNVPIALPRARLTWGDIVTPWIEDISEDDSENNIADSGNSDNNPEMTGIGTQCYLTTLTAVPAPPESEDYDSYVEISGTYFQEETSRLSIELWDRTSVHLHITADVAASDRAFIECVGVAEQPQPHVFARGVDGTVDVPLSLATAVPARARDGGVQLQVVRRVELEAEVMKRGTERGVDRQGERDGAAAASSADVRGSAGGVAGAGSPYAGTMLVETLITPRNTPNMHTTATTPDASTIAATGPATSSSDAASLENYWKLLSETRVFPQVPLQQQYQSNGSTTVYLSMTDDLTAGSTGTLLIKLQPVPRAMTAGFIISVRFPADAHRLASVSSVGFSSASLCTFSTALQGTIATALRATYPDSVSVQLSKSVSLNDGYILMTCDKATAPTFQVVMGYNPGEVVLKILQNEQVILQETHSGYFSERIIAPGNLGSTQAVIYDDGALLVLFQVPYAIPSGDIISLFLDSVWMTTVTLSCQVTGYTAASSMKLVNGKAVLNVVLPGSIPSGGVDAIYFVKCNNIVIPRSTNGVEFASMYILASAESQVRASTDSLAMPQLDDRIGAVKFEGLLSKYTAGAVTGVNVTINRFPLRVTSGYRIQLTLPTEYEFNEDNECYVSQVYSSGTLVNVSSSAAVTDNVVVFTMSGSLVEYPMLTCLQCSSVVIAVESNARSDIMVRLLNPLSNANQTALYTTTNGHVDRVFPGPVGGTSRAATVSNNKAGELSELSIILQYLGGSLDTGDLMLLTMDQRYLFQEDTFCVLYAYNDYTNVMGVGRDYAIKINTETLVDPLNKHRAALRVTETSARQLDLLKKTLTYVNVVCTMIRNPRQEVAYAAALTASLYPKKHATLNGNFDSFASVTQLLSALMRAKATSTHSMLPTITYNTLGAVVRKYYHSHPYTAQTGTLTVVISALTNPVPSGRDGGTLRVDLPNTWTVNAGGYSTACVASRYTAVSGATTPSGSGTGTGMAMVTTSGSTSVSSGYYHHTLRFKPSTQVTEGRVLLTCTNIRTPISIEGDRTDLTIGSYKDEDRIDYSEEGYLHAVYVAPSDAYREDRTTIHAMIFVRDTLFSDAELTVLMSVYRELLRDMECVVTVHKQRMDIGSTLEPPTMFTNATVDEFGVITNSRRGVRDVAEVEPQAQEEEEGQGNSALWARELSEKIREMGISGVERHSESGLPRSPALARVHGSDIHPHIIEMNVPTDDENVSHDDDNLFDDDNKFDQFSLNSRASHTSMHPRQSASDSVVIYANTKVVTIHTLIRTPSSIYTQKDIINALNSTTGRSALRSKCADNLDVTPFFRYTISSSSGAGNELCQNGVQDQDETDIDCGGTACSPCRGGFRCLSRLDCRSAKCVNNVCEGDNSAMGVTDARVWAVVAASVLLGVAMARAWGGRKEKIE